MRVPRPGSEFDLQEAADQLGTLAHVDHAQAAAVLVAVTYRRRIETHAVILDLQQQPGRRRPISAAPRRAPPGRACGHC